MFISPLSIELILAMISQGAANDTAEKCLALFKEKNKKAVADKYKLVLQQATDVEDITLNIANRIYIKECLMLKANFEKVINEYFMSKVTLVNFSKNEKVAKQINKFVEEKTNNKIKNLITPDQLSCDTSVVLINAIYFKGAWETPFNESRTEEDIFYTSEDDGVYCQLMCNESCDYNICWNHPKLNASIAEMLYLGGNASMVIILPNEIMGITEVEKQLADIDLLSLTNDLETQNIDFYLPKFKIETSVELRSTLVKLGLDIIFEPEADLSEIVENNDNVCVSKIIHKTFLVVNEKGCEAGAATGGGLLLLCVPTIFRADHPFIFYIRTRGTDNDTILFMGKVMKPEY